MPRVFQKPRRIKKVKLEKYKNRVQKNKWKSLKARGYRPASTPQENARRLKEAHGY